MYIIPESLQRRNNSLIQPQPQDRPGGSQQRVRLAVGDPPRGLPVDGRDDVTLADAAQRRLPTRVHLERER